MSHKNRKYQYDEETSSKPFVLVLGISLVLVVGFVLILIGSSGPATTTSGTVAGAVTATIPGEQILNLTAKVGYTPSTLTAKAGQAIDLQVTTNSTYDCSTGFNIPKFGISQTLPSTGVTDFKIPAQASGTTISGTCSMGMYRFKITVI